MADDHHHHHRPHRLSLPPRTATASSVAAAAAAAASSTPSSRPYLLYPYHSPTVPTPAATPSKHRHLSHSLSSLTPKPPPTSAAAAAAAKSSLSYLFLLLLFSLRSLYSLLPFLRSSSLSFSLFPFSFLVSLLSFLLTLSFSLFPSRKVHRSPTFPLPSLPRSHLWILLFKSFLLAGVFLLRFQALRYLGTAAMILAEMSGCIAFRFLREGLTKGSSKVRGFVALLIGLFFLSLSWDRLDCFPFSYTTLDKLGTSLILGGNCVRIWTLSLPFLSGFFGSYERDSTNWVTIRQLGRKRARLISLFFTTIVLFFPAVVSMLVSGEKGSGVSIWNLGWPLANTVLFGVLLSEWYIDEKAINSKDFEKEFMVTFMCTLVLELVYFPELSLWGLLICGFFFWVSIRHLNDPHSAYVEIGTESSESISVWVFKVFRHILSERKSRKIAMFLLINAGYMVVEFVAGFMSNSLGLITDACHMLFDCAALAIGLYASYISKLPANYQFNYGRGRFEVLSGYANAVFLVLVGALIVLESFERILDPQEISTSSLLTVSIGGLLVNIVGLVFFHEEHHHAHGGATSCSHSHHDHRLSPTSHDHKHITSHLKTESIKCDDHHDHVCCMHDDHHHHHHHHEQDDHHGHHHEQDHHEHHNKIHHISHDDPHQHDPHGSINVDTLSSHNSSLTDQKKGISHDQAAHNSLSSCEHNSSRQKPCFDRSPLVEPEKHHHHHDHVDHNMQGIFLHVLADTMGSVGVVVSTLLIKYKGWLVADPACSIFISILIVSSVIPLLRNSAEILLQRVPKTHEEDINQAVVDVLRIKGVYGIQSLHVWSLTNTDVVGTLHLHVSTKTDELSMKALISERFVDAGVKDLTTQVECVECD
ncbi:hypothetical protein Dimus_023091 [Dionaea muscipula]